MESFLTEVDWPLGAKLPRDHPKVKLLKQVVHDRLGEFNYAPLKQKNFAPNGQVILCRQDILTQIVDQVMAERDRGRFMIMENDVWIVKVGYTRTNFRGVVARKLAQLRSSRLKALADGPLLENVNDHAATNQEGEVDDVQPPTINNDENPPDQAQITPSEQDIDILSFQLSLKSKISKSEDYLRSLMNVQSSDKGHPQSSRNGHEASKLCDLSQNHNSPQNLLSDIINPHKENQGILLSRPNKPCAENEATWCQSSRGGSIVTWSNVHRDKVDDTNIPLVYKRFRSWESVISKEPVPRKPRLGTVEEQNATEYDEDEVIGDNEVIDNAPWTATSTIDRLDSRERTTVSSLTASHDSVKLGFKKLRRMAKTVKTFAKRLGRFSNIAKDESCDYFQRLRDSRPDSMADVMQTCDNWNGLLEEVLKNPNDEVVAGRCVDKLLELAIVKDGNFLDHVAGNESINAVLEIMKNSLDSAEMKLNCCSLLAMILPPLHQTLSEKTLPYHDDVIDEILCILLQHYDNAHLRQDCLVQLHLLVAEIPHRVEDMTKKTRKNAKHSAHMMIKLFGYLADRSRTQDSYLRLITVLLTEHKITSLPVTRS